jgi:SAM-dependent methyltransferase
LLVAASSDPVAPTVSGPIPVTEGAGSPSPWVIRYASLIPPDGPILDVACGAGRNARFFLDQERTVVAVDRDLSRLGDLLNHPALEAIEVDLEDGRPFPLAGRRFAGVVCTNYLYRPLLAALVAAVAPTGAFIYETFAEGHQRYGRPTRPEFLLRRGELRAAVAGELVVVADEEVLVAGPARVQHIAAQRP